VPLRRVDEPGGEPRERRGRVAQPSGVHGHREALVLDERPGGIHLGE